MGRRRTVDQPSAGAVRFHSELMCARPGTSEDLRASGHPGGAEGNDVLDRPRFTGFDRHGVAFEAVAVSVRVGEHDLEAVSHIAMLPGRARGRGAERHPAQSPNCFPRISFMISSVPPPIGPSLASRAARSIPYSFM